MLNPPYTHGVSWTDYESALCLKKMNTSLSVVIAVNGFLNGCVVIVAYIDHIIKGWWNFKHVEWELLAKAPMNPVIASLPGVHLLIRF